MFRNRSTYFYLAVAVGLFCYVAFVDKKMPGTREREAAEKQLYDLNPDDVIGLEITNGHGQFIFKKIDGHWEIKKPVDTPADGATIDGIINQIAFAQPQRLIEVDGGSPKDQANLKEWGLAPATERVVISTKAKHYELLLGRKMAINDSIYARASGRKNEPVRVLASSVKQALDKDLSDLRSRNVFDFDADKVIKVATSIADTSATPGQGQQCEVDLKDGKWTLQLPLVARASDTAVQALLGKILGLHAVDFVVDDASNLSTYGLSSPAATLTVGVAPGTDKSPDDLVLRIGGPVPDRAEQIYAQRLNSKSVFTLTKTAVNEVLTALPNVRDHRVLPFDPNKPTELSYAIGTTKAQVKSTHALWNTVGADAGPADVGKVNEILVKLSQLETTPLVKDSAVDLKPYGLDKPQGKITIVSPDAKPSGTVSLSIGKVENKLLYVRNSFEPFVYTVPQGTFDFLPANNAVLRDPRAINLQRELVKSVTVTPASTPPMTLVRSEGGTWTAANLKNQMVDGTKAETQMALFCQLQAKAWLGPALPVYALAKPLLTIAVLADQPKPTILRLGAALPDGSHAAEIEGDPTTFSISDADYGILNSSTLEPIPQELTNAPSASAPTTPAAPATNAPSAKPAAAVSK